MSLVHFLMALSANYAHIRGHDKFTDFVDLQNIDMTSESVQLTEVLLVSGGLDSDGELLASTEMYRPSAGEWRKVPGGRDKNQNNYADILEYSEEEEKWTRAGEMSEKTSFQAVSIA